jgi:hypothetical protein
VPDVLKLGRYEVLAGSKLHKHAYTSLISGFRCDVDELCGLLGNYTASCGNYFVIICNVIIVWYYNYLNNYHTTPCNYPEDQSSCIHILMYLRQSNNSSQKNLRTNVLYSPDMYLFTSSTLHTKKGTYFMHHQIKHSLPLKNKIPQHSFHIQLRPPH